MSANDPAFPLSGVTSKTTAGLTKREYAAIHFAAQAFGAACMATYADTAEIKAVHDRCCDHAIGMADLLLKKLEEKTNTMNELVKTKKQDIRALIQSDTVKDQLVRVLPKYMTAERMARVACTAVLKTPKLLECRPESLLQALMLCAQAGLEPDGRNAHLIPYGDQCQVIFDWKGLVALARRNGVANIAADVVCEGDAFDWYRDAEGLHFNHRVDWKKARGEVYAAYCIWKDGEQFDGEVMTRSEIEGIRKRSRAGNNGPWVTDWNEMSKKTTIRRASKRWPLSPEAQEAFSADDDRLAEVTTQPTKPLFETKAPVAQALTENMGAGLIAEEAEPAQDSPAPPQEAPKRRGRPPKNLAQPPAPEANGIQKNSEEPAAAPESSEPEQPSKAENSLFNLNLVKAVRGLCRAAEIPEKILIDLIHATDLADDSLLTLEAISEVQPSTLAKVMDNWQDFAKRIKGE